MEEEADLKIVSRVIRSKFYTGSYSGHGDLKGIVTLKNNITLFWRQSYSGHGDLKGIVTVQCGFSGNADHTYSGHGDLKGIVTSYNQLEQCLSNR